MPIGGTSLLIHVVFEKELASGGLEDDNRI